MKEYVIGLMSGTSLDGCDAALVSFDRDQVRLCRFHTHPMPDALKQDILACCDVGRSDIAHTCSLNFRLGQWFADAANALITDAGIDRGAVLAIGSHGQTVYHIPFAVDGLTPSTLQLGEPAVIAYQTGIPVVSSMRAMDMAAGGQGAPLVPFSEFILYRGPESVALQNIGGIGNVTVLPKNCTEEQVFAFDTGPGNMIIDSLTRHFYHEPYDRGGRHAAQGQVDRSLLSTWLAMDYLTAPPPKSTGRELYGEQFVQDALRRNPHIRPDDFIATATQYTADTMLVSYTRFVLPKTPDLNKIILAGGGAYNPVLVDCIRRNFPAQTVMLQEDIGWSSEAKEAVAFAVIARQTMRRLPGNLPAATGAGQSVPLGSITYPPQII